MPLMKQTMGVHIICMVGGEGYALLLTEAQSFKTIWLRTLQAVARRHGFEAALKCVCMNISM